MNLSYGTLVGPKSTAGSIRSWVNYDPTDVEGVLLDAQAYIYGALRSREMLSTASVSLVSGASTAALPDRFLDPVKMVAPTLGATIEPRDPGQFLEERPTNSDGSLVDAPPSAYAIYDELLNFNFEADATYALKFLFYRRPEYLGRTTPSNFLTTRYPNLLRVACLMHAADAIQDDSEYARWKARTDELIVRASIENDYVARGRDYSVSTR